MTITSAAPSTQTETKDALLAYLDALTLAEPIHERVWQEARITLTQLSLLRVLRSGPQGAGKLGIAVGVSPASLTRLVDRLENRGLVSRHRGDDDRRCVEVRIEPAGERLLGQMKVFRGSDLHHAVESMTPEERRRLTRSLRRLVELTRARACLEAGGK
jgi:DNA-binding MarR family transcriptional regulator